MSDCKKTDELISLYCDEKITQEENVLVENHIKSCEKCRQKLDTMLKAKEVLKNSPALPVPETMFADFLKNKEKSEKKEKKVVPFYKNYRMYASIAAIFIFAFVVKSGLLEKDNYISTQPEESTYQQKISDFAKDGKKEEIKPANGSVKTDNITNEKKVKSIPVETQDADVSVVSDSAESTPIQAYDETNTNDANAGGGGGSAAYARITPESEAQSEETEAFIYVSAQYLERATKLLGDNTYLLYQAEQKLTENQIPFESNFLDLNESQEYKINIMIK